MHTNIRRSLVIVTAALLVAAPAVAQAAPSKVFPASGFTASDTPSTNYGVSVTTPTSDTGPVHLTITGLADGDLVRITGAPQGWAAESWYDQQATQSGNGPLRVTFPGPLGWPENHAFVWEVSFPDGETRTTSFTYAGTPTTKPTRTPAPERSKQPSKKPTATPEGRGGLAKTGV